MCSCIFLQSLHLSYVLTFYYVVLYRRYTMINEKSILVLCHCICGFHSQELDFEHRELAVKFALTGTDEAECFSFLLSSLIVIIQLCLTQSFTIRFRSHSRKPTMQCVSWSRPDAPVKVTWAPVLFSFVPMKHDHVRYYNCSTQILKIKINQYTEQSLSLVLRSLKDIC